MQRESILMTKTLVCLVRRPVSKLFLFIAMAFLAGCSGQSTKELDLPTVSPTFTALPAIIPSAVLPTEASSITPEPVRLTPTHCQEVISSQLQSGFSGGGSIIFVGECEGREGLFKLAVGDQQITPVHAGNTNGFATPMSFFVSRDHQWLMYENYSYDQYHQHLKTSLLITGDQEGSKLEYPVDANWLAPIGWYGDSLAAFTTLRAPDRTVSLFNPFTGKVTNFHYSFDGFIRNEIYFDPPVARVLYFDENPGVSRYILKEIVSEKVLWQSAEDQMVSNFAAQPEWSPNGLFFAIPVWDQTSQGMFRFMLVSREGEETILDPVFKSDTNSPYLSFNWSPSGNYLVFWDSVPDSGRQLVIWDIRNNQFIDSSFTTLDTPGWPVFSPDEQQFVVDVQSQAGDIYKNVNYLVDMNSGQSVKLDLNLFPVAWLKPFDSGQHSLKTVDEMELIQPKGGNLVKQQCLEESSLGDTKPQFDGEIVYSRDLYLYSLQPDKVLPETQMENNQIMDAFVSPDRKALFYWYKDSHDNYTPHYWLSLWDGQRTEITKTDIIPEPDAIGGWFNDHEFWVNTKSSIGSVLLDPYENKYREPPEFEGPEMAGCIGWLICSYLDSSPFFYDTKFERGVFTTASSVYLMDQDANFLWQYENWLITLNIPKWSPDEQVLGVPLPLDDGGEHYEFFAVDRDGKARQITSYSAAYPTIRVDKFQWSPDGRYIAFWGDPHAKERLAQLQPYRLFVLDTQTHQTTDYCVSGDYSANKAPVWSPDGSQIAVNAARDDRHVILLVDFQTGTVSPLAEGNLIGWMAEP